MSSDKLTARVRKLDVQGKVVEPALLEMGKLMLKFPPGVPPPVNADLQAGLTFKKMKLFIRRVTCLEETSGIFEGSDEINMGGSATDPLGNTSKVNEFVVSDDFHKGKHVDFGMSRVFHTWDIQTKKEGFPYVYAAVIALAEKDDGGFWKFLKELWEKVKSTVTGAVSALAGAAIGAALGAAFGGIGAIVGALVGALIAWLINIFSDNADDILGAKVMLMTLGAANKSYYDWAELTSPQGWTLPKPMLFKGSGGRYEVELAYRVFTS
jgi:hypothetical protein